VQSSQPWRWIDSGFSDGAANMAIDLAILENASQTGIPTVRVYQWRPYCISLGHHQSVDHIDLEACEQHRIDVVRRPTGGRAVFHAEEITYSVIIPKTHSVYTSRVSDLYNLISQALVRGLRKQNIPATLTKRSLDINQHYQSSLSASCFSAAARHEVLLDKKKLIGSAQRHLAKGVLQHGSILTGDAHLDLVHFLKSPDKYFKTKMRETLRDKTINLNQYLKKPVQIKKIAHSLKQGFEDVFSVQFKDDGLNEFEKDHLESFRKEAAVFTAPPKAGKPSKKLAGKDSIPHCLRRGNSLFGAVA